MVCWFYRKEKTNVQEPKEGVCENFRRVRNTSAAGRVRDCAHTVSSSRLSISDTLSAGVPLFPPASQDKARRTLWSAPSIVVVTLGFSPGMGG